MRFILLTAIFLNVIFSVTVQAAPPSIEEYKNVREGVLLSEKVEDDYDYNDNDSFRKAVTVEDILLMYKNGKYKKAFRHTEPLAENGQHQAEEVLGIMYRTGNGVEQNNKMAFKWFAKAAEAKFPLAMHHIGIMFYRGEGTRQNDVRALMWLKLSQLYYSEGTDRDSVRQDYDNLIETTTRRDKNQSNELVQEWLLSKGDVRLLK
ncbi:MAG: sel1 repeat family protein [Proteobacteria bacterium]|nr:sel1 repeat family protein [Pseudomonadota bacterium]